jgi:lysophospholipase L1-like esterase
MSLPSLLFGLLVCQVALQPPTISPAEQALLDRYREKAVKQWEKEIVQLEQLDAKATDPDKAILFVGSSSIRRWESIAEDMAPWPTVRRGYGGAKFTDLVIFVERLVAKHNYRALVVFVGNDITGAADDRTPDEVLELYKLLVKLVRKTHPEQPIFFIAITPNSKRFQVWPKANAANQLIKQYSETDPLLHYIDTVGSYLDKDGKPRDELFVEDKLHQNQAGYKIWSSIIKSQLDAKLGK